MPDYNKLREICNNSSDVSSSVIDDFILHYAAKRDKLDQNFDVKLPNFRHVIKDLPPEGTGRLRAQYIGHRIFKHQGLIAKYLNHSAIKELDATQQNYLHLMAAHPWRFSFSVINGNPATDFYEMQDTFSDETFLLYSRSITQILLEHPVLLWFNLVGSNGDCWQTYGPVTGFQSFDADDIFFFATELNALIDTASDLNQDLENNPVPYMLLVTGSLYPLVKTKGFEVVHVISEGHVSGFDMQILQKRFKIEYAEGVFKISDKVLSAPPHFAEGYYDEEKKTTFLSAQTDRGYAEMANKLNTHGFILPAEPEIRVHLQMLTVLNNLLKRDLQINPYTELFERTPSPANEEMIEKINRFLLLVLPDINAGKKPDINAMAEKAGIDPKTARDLLEQSMNSIKKLRI